ncbi:MAG: hypothetical protein PHQ67_10735 [Fermentimonas sp.]|nr:hypothetical protein [Fermentimonas sp.]MDD4439650.1 hypothetical protein [Tissierellia bacterium]
MENGICGAGFYLYHRLKYKMENDDNILTLSLKEYLIYLIDWIDELLLKTNEKQDFNSVYFLLCRLQTLNLLNFKVEKMINYCLQKIMKFNYQFIDNYELLGINHLKALKLWI